MTFQTAENLAMHYGRLLGVRTFDSEGRPERWDHTDDPRVLARRIRALSTHSILAIEDRGRELVAFGRSLEEADHG